MFEPLSDSLRKIARGAGIAMVGMFLGLLFGFVSRFIVARYGLQANYGIFSLALVVLTFSMMLASLGLHQGVTRYIAYFQGKKEAAKVRESIYASLLIASVASIIIGIVLFFSAGVVALSIFHTIELEPALKIFALSIPFFTLINILSAIFRGFNRVEPQVYFQSILLNLSSLLLLLAVILL
ncbi:MAG: oligosaccharide flippase family protein [Chloroflexi bacterium]|nr:oligosaccharide flippase family protein [Chloroflexota bacterium]